MALVRNYYGSLCTEMYEILHDQAPEEELSFYLSYAEQGMKILEPLCGSGRFLIPFLKRGYAICGIDLSAEMLARLKEKAPEANVLQKNLLDYQPQEKFDYIFIPSGSLSLFTDRDVCAKVLLKMKQLLKQGGKFVFAVETILDRCPDDEEYRQSVAVKTKEGYTLILKEKNYYDENTQTQYSPGIYELYDGETLLQKEMMDFQTHLYQRNELEPYLRKIGFTSIYVYSSFDKRLAKDNEPGAFLYECSF